MRRLDLARLFCLCATFFDFFFIFPIQFDTLHVFLRGISARSPPPPYNI